MAARARFSLHPSLCAETIRREFDENRRVRIAPFLDDESALELAAHLQAREDWRLVLNAGEKVFEIDRPGQARLSDAERAALEGKVVAAARAGFQYRFESIRVPDFEPERRKRGSLLDELTLFLSSAPILQFFHDATGLAPIRFADAQATCYGPGHFLTRHDDDVAGKNRLAAYVLGLSRNWNADWGGLLLFHGEGGEIAKAMKPGYNMLTLFAVPQPHSVSLVTPYAGANRYSVTGWLRSAIPPES